MASRGMRITSISHQLGSSALANFPGMRTARMQMAPRRRIEGARRITRQEAAISPPVRGWQRYRGEQRLRVGMARFGENASRRSALNDAPEVHHRDTRGNVSHHREIVADEDVSEPQSLLQIFEQVQDLTADRNVEGGDRLIAHDELGLRREGPRDGDALALAA